MPSSQPDSTDPPTRSLNRWGIGTLSAVQLVLLAVCLFAANYLSAVYYVRADLSRGADYTLSQSTKRYLASDALSSREKPVKWIMAFRRTQPFHDRVRALAEEYVRLSKGNIELEVVDPLRSPDRAAQVMASYELSFAADVIIIDARTTEGSAVVTDTLGTHELNPHVKLVLAEQMISHETDRQSQRRPKGFLGEDLLTANLVEAIEGRPRTLLFLADKSRIDAQGVDSPWRTLEGTLRLQNIQLKAVNLSGLENIPEDAQGVALVAPQYDLTDAEVEVLARYWSRPRAALLILLEPGTVLPKLKGFLRANGVTPRNDRLVFKNKDKLETKARGTFGYNIDFIQDLAGQTSEFEGASASLEVRENADDLLNRKIYPWGLFQVSDGFWGETRFGEGGEAFDKVEDYASPLFLAASVAHGDMTNEKLASEVSRMVVVANTDFLKGENRRAENIDFLACSVNWLVGRDALTGVGPRSLRLYKLPLLDAQVAFINRVNLFFLPAVFGVLGLMVWSSRRA
ncbi:MAG: GldG family protein [Akkermansiaceae bacterium]|nr:GldG family protein [Akkermansiaceae bacterium]